MIRCAHAEDAGADNEDVGMGCGFHYFWVCSLNSNSLVPKINVQTRCYSCNVEFAISTGNKDLPCGETSYVIDNECGELNCVYFQGVRTGMVVNSKYILPWRRGISFL